MRELWAVLRPDEGWVRRARELGVSTFLALGPDAEWALEHRASLGIEVAADHPDADVPIATDPARARGGTLYLRIEGPSDLEAARRARPSTVIVEALDWRVIPLEELIASKVRVLGVVSGAAEARLFAAVLERGVDGLVARDGLEEVRAALSGCEVRLALEPAEVVGVREAGEGDRVCIDTCSLLAPGEGALVGTQASALFLVHAENVENPYVATRPFRVNAGPVHEYVLVGASTRYLSELSAGEPLLAVRADGATRTVTVGRAKIERRPLVLVEARAGDRLAKVILQNAETVRLVRPDGTPVPVTALKAGERVLVHLPPSNGRHFGAAVDESVVER